jgi:hypothetical protein
MLLAGIAKRSAGPGVMTLLLIVAVEAAAQAYRLAPLECVEQAPRHLLDLSPSFVRALDREHEMDLQALDAFAGTQRADGLRSLERQQLWTLYGRLGLVNFQNQLHPDSSGMQFSWRRTGPQLGGKIYLGIHRRF